jgi:hypothetical protein
VAVTRIPRGPTGFATVEAKGVLGKNDAVTMLKQFVRELRSRPAVAPTVA